MYTPTVVEKEILVKKPNKSDWEPNSDLLMHVASFDDWGTADLEQNIKEIVEDGGTPQLIKLRITLEVEYLKI